MIDSVPLIQNANDAQQINASIIALKKASRELDEKIVKLNSLNSELDKKIAFLDSGLNKEIEDRKEAINSLDVPSVGGSGKYISAISETDGKISATESNITSTVSSGNSQPVTSGGVADAIDKIIVQGGNLNTIYPSVNEKVKYYKGNFLNAPKVRDTAIVRVERVESSNSSEVQLYQEWISYGNYQDNYTPDKYYRFGYFTGSASPTWTDWQKITITKELNEFIKYKAVSIPSITLTANGYADISNYMPSGMNNFLFAILYNYGNVSTKDALGVIGAGTYLFGTANATITNVVLRYYYFD